jgi:hypoxanthine-DNA glycosylase
MLPVPNNDRKGDARLNAVLGYRGQIVVPPKLQLISAAISSQYVGVSTDPSYEQKWPMKYCLDPVVTDASRFLILGSLPGDESLRKQQYYANPRNQFWSILAAVFDVAIGSSYCDKIAFLHSRGLALWDVLSGAERQGSLDSRIKNGEANGFSTFFVKYPNLLTVVFNGGKSEELFKRLVHNTLPREIVGALQFIRMPSTSATPGRNVLPFPDKAEQWKALKFAD